MYQIYCDLDGVLCGFIEHVQQHHPHIPNWADDEILWPAVNSIPDFWTAMPWKSDGQKLWNFIKPLKPTILSAPSRHDPRSVPGKIHWVQKNLGHEVPIILTRSSEKKNHAKPKAILIDDLLGNIRGWKDNGGRVIHHKNAEDTIIRLKKILDEP